MRTKGRNLIAAMIIATSTLTTFLTAAPPVAAQDITAEIVSDNPANFTPDVLDGSVYAIAEVGDRVIIGGTFTQVQNAGGGTIYNREFIAALDASTGQVDTGFAPDLDGSVSAIVPAGDGASVYVTGSFRTVNGSTEQRVTRLNVATGNEVPGFEPGSIFAEVRDARLVDDVLIIAGRFISVAGQPRGLIASLDADTGALTGDVALDFSGTHNGGGSNIAKIEVTPAGDRLLAIGNFTDVDGQFRDQIAMLDLSGPTATLSSWYTDFYESTCASVFNTYMRDLDISEDGTYAVVSTTGAYFGGINAGVSCDTISRFPVYVDSPNLAPTWATYTGGDTTYAVEIARGVVYAGGHMRWVNNPYAGDTAGPGAIPREGIVALDPVNGMPFSWDPGRSRGVGVFDFLVTEEGLWAGSDTEVWAGERRERLAFFPYANGTEVHENLVGGLPNDIYLLGRSETTGDVDPSVLYRVNAGGPALPAADDGPGWEADQAGTSPYRNSGSNAAGWGPVPATDGSLPADDFDRAPLALFSSERWDPLGDPEMQWSFPVAAGTSVELRLYLANRCTCTNDPGERIFDIDVEGAPLADDLDLSASIGHDVATMLSTQLVSDGSIDIQFRHVVENPLINGIEIIRTDVTGGGINADDDVRRRYFDGSSTPDATDVFLGTEAWHLARGGFIVNDTVYTGWADGALYRRTFDGTNWGPRLAVALYGNTFINDLPSITGMFFDPVDERIYYTRSGSGTLFWRHFTPESHSVGATPFTATGDIASLAPNRVQGMFLSNDAVFFADASTGDLLRVGFVNGVVTGPATMVDDTEDWRTRVLFAWNGIPAGPGNVAPTADISASCTELLCSFDGTGSTDPDGTVVDYQWNFGDGNVASGATPDHTFAAGGTYTVTLTVTDNDGATNDTAQDVTVTPGNVAPTADISVSCTELLCSFDGTGSTDPDGTVVDYQWNFGDGNVASGATPDHTFAAGGTYTVTLTVTDNDGATNDTAQDVTVTPGNVAPTADISVSCTELLCSFDGTGSTDPDGTVVDYQWNFGDGNVASGATPDHTFAAGGTYTVTLTVTDNDGATNDTAQDVTVTPGNVAPTADISVSCTELLCSFDGTGSTDPDGTVVDYQWNFGDGNVASGATPDHTFAAGGTYTVTLTVTDNDGATNDTAQDVTVTPGNVAPTADISASCTELLCSFDGTGSTDPDGTVVDYQWNFGDGNVASGATPDHTFAAGGTYTVTLTVTDNDGATNDTAQDVTVTPGNVAPTADISASCTELLCSFDGTGSTDPDGTVVDYQWNFGDGNVASGATPDHTFAAGGTYTVTLTVTDNDGATNDTAQDVTVTESGTADVAFRSAASSNGNVLTGTVTVPGNVASGDTMVLFITVNRDTTITTPPDGWTQLGAVASTPTDTWSWVFTRTAPDGYAGTDVEVTFADRSKTDMSLLAYSGTAPVTLAIGDEADTASNTHTAPDVPITITDSWVLAYWADESSDNTGWTLPVGITERTSSVGTGGGRITAIVGDTGPLPIGIWSGATATSNTVSSKAPTWSVLLTPSGAPPVNVAPTADISASCTELLCSFDGTGSTDPDGTVVDYQWNFGDGNVASGATPDHTFAAGGTYTVTLTVTDNDGATNDTAQDVTVTESGTADVAFRSAASSNGNVLTGTVTVPGNVASGDTMVLFITVNRDTTITTPPDGWTQLGAVASTPTDTWSWVFTRTAPDGYAGTDVEVTFADRSKTDMSLLAYSGTAPVTLAIGDEADTASNTHTAPDVPITITDSWVLAYWADESSDNTGWTLPVGITERTSSVGTGGGRITAIVGDTGPLPIGIWSGATATSNTVSSKAPTWSVLLTPG